MEPLSKEDLRYLELSMFDGSFLSSDSPNYPIFRQQCDELMTLMKEKSHARDDTQIAVLLKENDGWGKNSTSMFLATETFSHLKKHFFPNST